MWGRMIGVAFLVPAAFFLSKGWVNRSLKFRLAGNAALLGFQVRFMNLPMNIEEIHYLYDWNNFIIYLWRKISR